MKKRILSLILVLATMLCACGTSEAEVEVLEQRIETLEAQLAEFMVAEPVVTEPLNTEPLVTEPVITEDDTKNSSDMKEFLDNLLKSSNPDDWLAVAQCEAANYEQLLECAEKCASLEDTWLYTATEMAKALVEHRLADGRMIEELCNSAFSDIWEICARAECNDEQSLLAVTRKCASLEDTWFYTAPEMAKALVEHRLANGRMIEELCKSVHSDIWEICARAECNDEQSLIAVAKKCASLGDTWFYTAPLMAKALVEHSEFSVDVALELSLSCHTDVKNIAHCALENLENNN